ncbi:MAG: TonB-dependent receptor [Ignavibacteriaceae bacterium]
MYKSAFTLFHFILVFLLIVLITGNVYSQDTSKVYKLSEIVVTATRTNTPSVEIASSISVIDSAEIAQSNKINVLGLLKDQYGLSISQSGGPGQLAQLYMRGADPGDVLVLIDGVKLNPPEFSGNSYDFSNLPIDNIERIEILRGPQSTLYGSDAMAGVINIITKKGDGKPSYFFNIEDGSLNSFKGLAGTNGSYEQADYSVTFSKTKSNGVSAADVIYGNTEPDGYDDYNISSRFGWTINPDIKLNAYAEFNSGKIDLDQHGGPYGDDPTYMDFHEQGAYKAEANITGLQGLWQQDISFSFMRDLTRYNYDSTLNNPASSRSFYQGNIYQLEWQNNIKILQAHFLTFGFSAGKENSSSADSYLSSEYGNFISAFPEKDMNTFSGYLQDQIKISSNVFTIAGIRYDNYGNLGSALTYRVTQTYLIEETGTKLKAVFGTGFKAPSLFNLYDPNYGNPDLKSEKSNGWEAGFEQYLFNYDVLFGVTYFSNNFWDLIGYNSNYVSINIDKAQTDGIESYLTAEFSRAIRLNASYTLTNTIDKAPTDENFSLIRRPKNSAALTFNYNFSNEANANFDIVYVGKRDDEDFSVYPYRIVQLSAYTLLNISAAYSILKNVQLYGRIENALNEKYEDVWGFGTAGRTGYIGLKLNIK